MPTSVRHWFPIFLGLFFAYSSFNAQTVLRPGDLAILGVNANLNSCGQGNVDLISFVCFRDIETGTVIDITDNGWERANAGQWGNSEGFITVRRTGATIPAGTIITFELPPVGQSNAYRAVAPDGGWQFTQLSFSTLNFNSGGDQIYFMQGGEWNRGNDNVGSPQHDATYTGGVILFGFNTKTVWNSRRDNSQDSGLHPDVEPCYHMEPTSGTTDFISYSGPATPAGQLEWIARIADAANWSTYPDCPAYVAPTGSLNLQPNDIDLACTTCTGCDTLQETLRFTLPTVGGPFTVVYTDSTNTYTATGLNNGDTDQVEATKTVTYEIISVEDANGCPMYSNLGDGTTVTINAPPAVSSGARLEACADSSAQALFDLTSIESAVNLSPGEPVAWFEDAAGSRPVATPTAYLSGADTVYALVGSAGCTAGPVPVELAPLPAPDLVATVEQNVSCQNFFDGEVRLTISGGVAPYRIDWNDNALSGEENPRNLAAGDYTVTVTDAKGCQDSAAVTITAPAALELSCGQQQPVSQVGGADGQAAITVGGGVAPYRISWSGPVGNNRTLDSPGAVTIDNLSAGNYSVEVIDQNGCSITCSFTISDPNCTLNVALTKQDVTCAGLNDGAVDLTVTGGRGPYDFNWGGAPLDGQEDLTGLAAGTYTVVVTDADGCTATGNVVIASRFPRLAATITTTGPVCPGECAGFLLTLEGSPPFTLRYEVVVDGAPQPRTFTTSNRNDQFELCPADFGAPESIEVHFTELADVNCVRPLEQTASLILLPESAATLDTLLCFGDSLIVNGVTYNAANPRGTEVLAGGAVTGCDSTVTLNLRFTEAAQLRIDSTLCAGESITVNGVLYDEGNPTGREVIKGGGVKGCDSLIVVNLTYRQASARRLEPTLCRSGQIVVNGTVYNQNNPSGREVLVGSNGCDSIVTINLRFVDEVVRTIDSTLCGDDQILVNRTVYNRANPRGREVIRGGAVGGCDSVIVVNLTFGGGEVRIDSTLCQGSSLVVNGAVYDESNPSGQEILSSQVNGCDSIINVNLRFEGPVTTVLDTTLCTGESITVNGVVYDEARPSGAETLLRASGCDSVVQINLRYVAAVRASLEGGGRICPGASAQLTFRLSGATTANVQYSDGANPPVTLANISDGHVITVSPTVTTTYRIEFILVAGASCPAGIEGTATVEISDLALRLEATDYDGYGVPCAGATDGEVRAVASGNAAPFAIAWSTGDSGERLGNLAAGAYAATVTDAAGCTQTDSMTLTQPDALLVQTRLLDPTCPDDRDGAIIVEGLDGGAAPYLYSINGAAPRPVGELPLFIRDIGAGAYQLTITDQNGCQTSQSFDVAPVTQLELELGPDTTLRRGDSLRLTPRLNFTADSLLWSPTTGLSNPLELTTTARPAVSTTYILTAFDPKGCRISDRLTIRVEERSRIYIPNAFSPNDDGVNDEFHLLARPDDVQTYTLRIFDRWGGIVYERLDLTPNADSQGWDGTVRGKPAHPGVYVYFAEISYVDGSGEIVSGEIALLR